MGRLHRQHHVPGVRRRVPDPDFHLRWKVEAHLPKDGARLADHPRAIFEVLVPVGGQADDRVRGARALRAHDHIVHAVRVLQHDEMPVVRRHGEPELGDGLAAVRQQTLAEGCIRPRPGHDPRTILRYPFLLNQARVLVDEVSRLHAPRLERGLERRRALVHGGRSVLAQMPVCHVSHSWRSRDVDVLPGLSMPTPTCATPGCTREWARR
jgi:hypothetical protein